MTPALPVSRFFRVAQLAIVEQSAFNAIKATIFQQMSVLLVVLFFLGVWPVTALNATFAK